MSRTWTQARPPGRFVPASLWKVILGCVVAVLFASCPAEAADLIIDGAMEIDPLTNWGPIVDVSGSNSLAVEPAGTSPSGQSLSITSDKGSNAGGGQSATVEWYNEQLNIGSINSTDTVNLSFWYGIQWNNNTTGASGTLNVDIKPTSGTWAANSINLSTQAITPSTTFQQATVNEDVSSKITATDTYDIRLHFSGVTGTGSQARALVYWDDVVLDAAGPACTHAQPTVTMVTADQPACRNGNVDYNFTVTNNCSAACGNETFVLSYADDAGGFASSGPGNVSLDPGATDNLTMNVALNGTATGTNTSTITATLASHTDGTNSDAQTTADTTPPSDTSWNTNTPGDGQVVLNWANPGADQVLIIRDTTTPVPDSPTDGTDYSGDVNTTPVGWASSVVIYVGTGVTHTDTTVANDTTYYYRIFVRDICFNYSTPGAETSALTPTAGGNIAPTISNTQADDSTSTGTNITTCSGNNVTVTADIDDSDGDPLNWTIYTDSGGGFTPCSSDTGVTPPVVGISCTLNGITATTDYYVEVTDGTDTTTDPVGAPASFYTITVDTTPPSDTSWNTNTPGNAQVVLNWSNAGAAPVLIIRDTTTPVPDSPTDGTDYSGDVGTTPVGWASSVVIYAGTGSTHTDTTVVNDTTYYYRIFVRDDCFNYSTPGAETAGLTPTAPGSATATIRGSTLAADDPGQWTWPAPPPTNPLGDQNDGTLASVATETQIMRVDMTEDAGYNCRAINSVTLWFRAQMTGSGQVNEQVDFGVYGGSPASDYFSGSPVSPPKNTWTTFPASPFTMSTRPWDGQPWTWSDIDGLVMTFQSIANGGWNGTLEVADVWAEVDYDPGSNVCATVTIGEGTDNSADVSNLCPDNGEVLLDHFTLTVDSGTETVTHVEVTLAGGTWNGVGTVEIKKGGTPIGSATPTSDVVTVDITDQSVDQNVDAYQVWITPRTHAAMPAPAGATYSVTGTVSDVTTTAAVTDSDNLSATINIDNESPNNLSWGTIQTGDQQITLNWSNPGPDPVVIVRDTGSISVSPIEGKTDYTTADTIGGLPVVYVGTGSSFTDGPSPPLTNGQNYYYMIFVQDTCGNFSTGAETGPHQPQSTKGTVVGTNTAVESSCTQITATSEYSDDSGPGNSPGYATVYWDTTLGGVSNTACEKLDGPSPRQCLVTGFPQGQNVYIRVVYTDTDGVTGNNPWDSGAFNTTCGPDSSAPTVMFMVPSRNSVIGGVDKVKVQVYDAGPLASVDPVQWKVDNDSLSATGVLRNANYDTADDGSCGTGCGVYEFDLDTTSTGLALSNGAHVITVQVVDDAGNTAVLAQPVTVQNSGEKAAGDGFLLRRSHGSQLCVDCHNLKTHSSKNTSTAYGNWAIECVTCHTPHNTRNIHLIRESIETPNSGTMTGVTFQTDTPGNPSPNFGFLGDRSLSENAPYNDGICEVCHTRTNFHRNKSVTSGNAAHHGHEIDNSGRSCVGCHGHQGGFKPPACNECHNAPPTIGKHSVHDQVGSTPESYTNTAPHATTTQYGFACRTCHDGGHINDGSAGTAGDPYDVEVSFNTSIYTQNDNGAYTAAAEQGPDQGPDNNYWSWSDGSCANVYCHSIAQRTMTVDTTDYKTVTWNQAGSLTCISCHDDGGADSTLTSAHVTHTNTLTYQFGCVRCHASTVSSAPDVINPATVDKTKHVDGTRTVIFDASGPNNSGGSYDQSGGSPPLDCSNTYCHSSGQDRNSDGDNSYTSGPSIAWTSSGTCTSCHDDGGTGTTLSGPHLGHTDANSPTKTAYGCVMCHAVTVSSAATTDIAPTAVDLYSNHVNVIADVDFHASVPVGASPGFTAGNDGEGSCADIGCHSSGQATPTYRNPAWNDSPSNVCMYCHGTEGGGVAGEPRYANGGTVQNNSNSHPAHVGAAADCANCHNDTTTTANTITTPANHLDGNRQIAIAAAYDANGGTGADNYVAATKTCNGLNGLTCHTSKQWGGAKLVCLDCHDGAGSDTDSWTYNDGTKAAINVGQWRDSGHGRTVSDQSDGQPFGNYPGTNNPAANLHVGGPNPCLYCHTGTVGHNNGNNIFRLRNVGAASSATDFAGVCLACHGDSGGGVDPDVDDGVVGDQYTSIDGTKIVNSYHYGDKHSGNDGGQFCWDCHDPHGDRDTDGVGSNIAMLHDQVTQVSNGLNGIPTTQVTVTFTQRTGLEDYVERGEPIASPPSTKLCNTCHTDSSLHFTQTKGDSHKLGDPDSKGSCAAADCHEHDRPEANTAFGKPLGGPLNCLSAGCHDQAINGSGGPYGAGTYTRRAVTASGDFANTTAGGDPRSHHVGNTGSNMGGTLSALDCIVCHAEGTYTGTAIPTGTAYHLNKVIDLYDADDTTNVFSYDVDKIRYDTGGAGTDPGSWNSSNQVWREETSGRLDADAGSWPTPGPGPQEIGNGWPPTLQPGKGLDRFCISCHDADGATATYSRETHPAWSQGNEAQNPFADGAITNEYDQMTRYDPPIQPGLATPVPTPPGPQKVVDVKSQVLAPPLFSVPTPSPTPPTDADGDNLADPPNGVFARHAIRGMAPSVYKTYENLPTGTSIWEHLDGESESALMQTDLTGPNQGGPNPFGNDEWGRPIWNDSSVMGCADCHTSDGANAAAGNAHGSDSEYLLKDSHGTATRAVEGNPLPTNKGDTGDPSYICYKCHNWDLHGMGVGHTGSQADYKDSVGGIGKAGRVTGSAGIFGIACLNCHGAPNWGTVHGTTQEFKRPGSGGPDPLFQNTIRKAYRFMNGGAQRFYIENNTQTGSYDPDDWSGTSVTCWTISAGDDWSSCTQHANGVDWTQPLDRPLRY